MRRVLVIGLVLAGVALVVIVVAAIRGVGREPHIRPASEAILAHKVRALQSLVGASSSQPLVRWHDVLVAVDQGLVQDLLVAVAPYERTVADRYRVRVEAARVRFEDGLALVRLDGRAGLVGPPGQPEDLRAAVSVYGSLDVTGIDRRTRVLRARIQVLGLEARRIEVLGQRADVEPVRQLVEDLGHEELHNLRVLGAELEIPVRIEEDMRIPELGPEGGVHIPAANIPLHVAIEDVRAFGGKLWIAAHVELVHPGAPAAARSPQDETRVWRPGPERASDSPRPSGLVRVLVAVPRALSPRPLDTRLERRRVARLERRYRTLRAALDQRVAADPILRRGTRDTAEVALFVREPVVRALISAVARRYLDRVTLDLPTDVRVERRAKVRANTFLGRFTAGSWRARIDVDRVRGRLRALPPRVQVARGNRIHVVVPAAVERGEGVGTLRFEWDPSGAAGLLCRSFEKKLLLTGVVYRDTYPIAGDLVMTARGEDVVAVPDFPRPRYRLRLTLTPASWARVRRELAAEDRLFRCGTFLNPDHVVDKLRAIGLRGVDVRIPRAAFRPIRLPGSVSHTVLVQDRQVDLAVVPETLRSFSDGFWYSARVYATPERPVVDSLAGGSL